MSTSRRAFLKGAAATTAAFAGLAAYYTYVKANPTAISDVTGYGPLIKDPKNILDLPEGFSYRILSTAGETMTDGFVLPARPDGMAAFATDDGRVAVVRNHELNPGDDRGPFGKDGQLFEKLGAEKMYDAGDDDNRPMGGTTTFIYNPVTGLIDEQYLTLAGTIRNCAGGPTPWGSWLSCEESLLGADDGLQKMHGYVFEVPSSAKEAVDPKPITGMGRFNHEAAAVDPKTGIVYQTEDDKKSLFYRFIPNVPGDLHQGGKLQALAFIDIPSADTRNWGETDLEIKVGNTFKARWIDMDDTHNPDGEMMLRGFEAGAARFARGEGLWFGDNEMFFTCTSGGDSGNGQIWRYTPSAFEGTSDEANAPGVLELFVESHDADLMENCDNVTVAPWGDLIVCEDGRGDDYLRGVTAEGKVYPLAHNATGASELTGACFSPDGEVLFVNIQDEQLTIAIKGPWANRKD